MRTRTAPALTQDVLGVHVDALTLEEVLDRVHEVIAERGRLQIGVINAAKLVNMRHDATLCEDVLSSDLILADGLSVVWASRLLGRALPERVAGIDLMLGMLRRGNEHGYRIYCLGATEEVLTATIRRIRSDYPRLEIAGHHHGYFTPEEEPAIAHAIAEAQPDILLVGMTSPRKEHFLARWSESLAVPVCHGVGGSFDVVAGKVERAPLGWQRLGLEWLYRVKQEPRRLWRRYLVTNTAFCALVARAWIAERVAPRPLP
jgi:N-acetylglucosaminyldiphosphoundecaprenol N-acetyl-beta-D-mannosaminyltransferase